MYGQNVKINLPIAKSLNLKGLVVASQGAIIADIESEKEIRNVGLTYKEAIDILNFYNGKDLHLHIYCGDEFYSNKNDDMLALYESICKIKANIEPDLIGYLQKTKQNVQKICVLFNDIENNEKYLKEAIKAFGNDFYVTTSAKCLVEIAPKQYTKGEALKYLCKFYNINIKKSIALGDQLNDAEMISYAGLGVAVANCHERLKDVADVISCSNNEGAVGKIINYYCLGEN